MSKDSRALTSGQQPSVPEGVELIGEPVDLAARRIVIMPGCGIDERNVREIVEQAGVREDHFTAFTHADSGMIYRNPRPFMGSIELSGEYDQTRTDAKRVHDVVSKVEGVQ